MPNTLVTESKDSPAPGIIPEPTLLQDQLTPAAERSAQRAAVRAGRLPPSQPKPRNALVVKLLRFVRGNRYVIDADPPPTEPGTAK